MFYIFDSTDGFCIVWWSLNPWLLLQYIFLIKPYIIDYNSELFKCFSKKQASCDCHYFACFALRETVKPPLINLSAILVRDNLLFYCLRRTPLQGNQIGLQSPPLNSSYFMLPWCHHEPETEMSFMACLCLEAKPRSSPHVWFGQWGAAAAWGKCVGG